MPYISEKIPLPRNLDRRVKITDDDKEQIKWLYKQNTPIREIARQFEHKCSRRLIQFILFPERAHASNYSGHWKKYYNKEKNTKAIRNTRNYKQQLYLKKIICPKN